MVADLTLIEKHTPHNTPKRSSSFEDLISDNYFITIITSFTQNIEMNRFDTPQPQLNTSHMKRFRLHSFVSF